MNPVILDRIRKPPSVIPFIKLPIYSKKSYKLHPAALLNTSPLSSTTSRWKSSSFSSSNLLIHLNNKRWVSSSESCNTGFTPGLHIQKLSQLLAPDECNLLKYKQVELSELINKTESKILSFSTFQLYQILTLFARHKSCPESILRALLMELVDRLNNSKGSLSNLHLSHLPLLLSNISLDQNQMETVMTFLMQFTKVISQDLKSQLEDQKASFGHKDNIFTEQEIAFLSLGLSNLGYRNHTLLYDIAEYFIRCTRFEKYLHKTKENYTNGNSLVNLFLSFSTMGVKHPVFYQELTSKLSEHMIRFSASQITNIGIALATLSADLEFPLFLSFLNDFEAAIKRLRFVFTPQDAITMSWVVCCLEIYKSVPSILIDLIKTYSPNISSSKSDNKEVLNQIKQVLITLELDPSDASSHIKYELRKQGTWECLQKMEYISEKAREATPLELEIKRTLEDPKNSNKLFVALCHSARLPDNTPYKLNILLDKQVQKLYFAPIIIEFLDPYATNETRQGNALFRVFISDNSSDLDDPHDPYESLKRKHLNMMHYIYVSNLMSSLTDANSERLLDFVIGKISEAYFEQFSL